MATKLYFHNAATAVSGTLPTGEQSAATPTWSAAGAATLRVMNTTLGTAQSSLAGTTAASTAAQTGFMGFFCSQPLNGAQTVGGGSMVLGVADAEGNAAANFWVNALEIYVWRPSTGAKIGTVKAVGASLGGLEPTAAGAAQTTYITAITSAAVAAGAGDVVVCEVWSVFTQAMATAYTGTFYYAGTTDITAENAATSSAASFVELTETLAFQSPPVTLALTGNAATSAAGTAIAAAVLSAVAATGTAENTAASATSALTGNAASLVAGSVTAVLVYAPDQLIELSLGEIASFELAGEFKSGDGITLALTGVSATATVGALAGVIAPAFTGVSATASVGAVTPSRTTALTGAIASGVAGNSAAVATLGLSGAVATASAGLVTASATGTLTGNGASAAVGTVASARTVGLAGVSSTASVGALAVTLAPALTGATAPGAVGSVAQVTALAGTAATAGVAAVSVATSAAVTGAAGTASVGSVVSGQGKIGTTGTTAVGQLGASITIGLTGVTASASAETAAPRSSSTLAGQFATGGVYSLQALLQATLLGTQAAASAAQLVAKSYSAGPSALQAIVLGGFPAAVAIAYVLAEDTTAHVPAQDNQTIVPPDLVDATF